MICGEIHVQLPGPGAIASRAICLPGFVLFANSSFGRSAPSSFDHLGYPAPVET
jgi:hypothetical protein